MKVMTTLAVLLGLPLVAMAEDKGFSVGDKVPVFTLKAVNPDDSGENYVSIDKYYGGEAKEPKKAVMVSFFATYCEPCKREMPFLAALYDTYKDQGLQVLLVSIDKEAEKIDIAKQLAKEHGVNFPVLSDRFNIVAKRYMIEKLPCVYILDNQGAVSMVSVGYTGDISQKFLDQVRKQIGVPVSDEVPERIAAYLKAHHDGPASVAVADAGGSADEQAAAAEAKPEDNKAKADVPSKGKKKAKKRKKRRGKRKKK